MTLRETLNPAPGGIHTEWKEDKVAPALRIILGWLALLPLHRYERYDVPWVPTRRELIKHIIRIAGVRRGDVFYDLGCGDGRVVIEAVKHGARGVCIEIRPDLIKEAMKNAKRENVYDRISFIQGDFYTQDLSKATVIYMYLLTRVNAALKPKLEREARVGTRIITLDFEIPGWRPVHVEKHYTGGLERTIYLYIRGVSDIAQ